MAKLKNVEEKELTEKELQKVSDALSEKDLYETPSAEDADLYKPELKEEKEVQATPGHTTRAFRQ